MSFIATHLSAKESSICLTGKVASNLPSYKKSFINSVTLAMDEENKSKDISIKTFFYDNKPLSPIDAFNAMLKNNCSTIIGFEYLSDLLLVIKNMRGQKIPIFTPYASTKDKEILPDNIYIFMPTYKFLTKKMIEFLSNKFGKIDNILITTEINRIEMINYKDLYISELKKINSHYENFYFLENDRFLEKKLLKKIKGKKYNYVFLLSGSIASSKIADILNNGDTVFVGTETFGSSSSQTFYTRITNKNIKAYFIRNIDFLAGSPALSGFNKKYMEKFKEPPTVLSAYAYDAAKMSCLLIKKRDHNYHSYYHGITGASLTNMRFNRSTKYIILATDYHGYKQEK